MTYHSVPVKLTNSSLFQMLLGTCDILTGGKIRDDLLTSPASVKDFRFRITETPFEINNKASVSALGTKVVRILEVELRVCPSYYCSSLCLPGILITYRELVLPCRWHQLVLLVQTVVAFRYCCVVMLI
jgi:hypothetical protein